MPCQSPKTIRGQIVGCNSCDSCVGRRVHSWCARCMMEKETMGHALVFALTYSEETEHSRMAAKSFCYNDVQRLMWSIRRQVAHHYKRTAVVSFIAAGEKGERFSLRCHWHVVVFSEVDLTALGTWLAPWGQVKARREIITPAGVKPAWRRNWSLWPHGFVTVQEPDYGGMRYALAYALKDQFNVRNSEGTAREAKAETFGTGYLVMSKKPPIGARWVDIFVEQCREAGVVPPTRRLRVAGLEKPFWPTGLLADRLLTGLASVNADVVAATGKPATGWTSLLHEVKDSPKHLESLGMPDGKEEQKPEELDPLFGLRVEARSRWRVWQAARREYRAAKARDDRNSHYTEREAASVLEGFKAGHGSGPSF